MGYSISHQVRVWISSTASPPKAIHPDSNIVSNRGLRVIFEILPGVRNFVYYYYWAYNVHLPVSVQSSGSYRHNLALFHVTDKYLNRVDSPGLLSHLPPPHHHHHPAAISIPSPSDSTSHDLFLKYSSLSSWVLSSKRSPICQYLSWGWTSRSEHSIWGVMWSNLRAFQVALVVKSHLPMQET